MLTVALLLPPFMQKITSKLPAVVPIGTVTEVLPLPEKFCAAWTTERGGGARLVSEKLAGVFIPPANVPLAPLVGAVKVTVTPLTRLFEASFTVACSCVAKGWLMTALCGVPAVA